MRRVGLRLQPSESVVVRVAGDILAALIQSGKYEDDQEDQLIDKSIQTAIKIALRTEQKIRSDHELE